MVPKMSMDVHFCALREPKPSKSEHPWTFLAPFYAQRALPFCFAHFWLAQRCAKQKGRALWAEVIV